jgi:DNA-binding MarR family transcriptional regulator
MTDEPSLMVRLSSLLLWFDESLQSSLAKAGFKPVTRAQSLFLLCLASGENRPSRIAEMLGLSRQTISHTITELSRRGLITLAIDPEDGRGRIVEYSHDADDLRRAAHAIVAGLDALLERRIGPRAFRGLQAGLARDWGATALIDPQRPTEGR